MGEVADSIIRGEMCQYCGDWLGEAVGYPRNCPACESSEGVVSHKVDYSCPLCNKKCKTLNGVKQHAKDKHPKRETECMKYIEYWYEFGSNPNDPKENQNGHNN